MPKLSLAQEKAALKKRLAEIAKAERAEDEQRTQLIGRVVRDAAKTDQALKAQLDRILHQHVKGKANRRLLGLTPGFSDATPKAAE